MSDDLDKKIQQIAEMLGQDKVPDNVKNLVSLLASSMNNREGGAAKAPEEEDPEEEKTEKAERVENEDNSDMMRRVKKLVDGLNTGNAGNDPRINLLHAIKPFMNSKRQKKIGNAIQLLQIASLTKLINNDK